MLNKHQTTCESKDLPGSSGLQNIDLKESERSNKPKPIQPKRNLAYKTIQYLLGYVKPNSVNMNNGSASREEIVQNEVSQEAIVISDDNDHLINSLKANEVLFESH